MSGRPRKVRSYCRHKASGQACVTIDGREHYLGSHGTSERKEKYARLIAERQAQGKPPNRAYINDHVASIKRRYRTCGGGGSPGRRINAVTVALRPHSPGPTLRS